jgi:hypothetical protein
MSNLTGTLQSAVEQLMAPLPTAFDAAPATPQRRKTAVGIVCSEMGLTKEEQVAALKIFTNDIGFVDVFISLPISLRDDFLKDRLNGTS